MLGDGIKIVLILIGVGTCMLYTQSKAFGSDYYILSTGSKLIGVDIEKDKIVKIRDMLNTVEWSNASWPAVDRERRFVYFQAKHLSGSSSIYRARINRELEGMELVTKGIYPSISRNGKFLVFYRHPGLWIRQISSGRERKLVDEVDNTQPAVWIDDESILFNDKKRYMVSLNTATGTVSQTGYLGIIPSALSNDGKKVLCGSYKGKSVHIYSLSHRTVEKIMDNMALSIRSNFVWGKHGKSFLYSRQTWSSAFRMKETQNLFKYVFGGKKSELYPGISLFGGSYIPMKKE